MKLTQTPRITYKQTQILALLYTHRFLTRLHIQTFMKHKDKKTINLWLKDLRQKAYINWIYNKDHFAEKTKPAIYYLSINALRYMQNLDLHPKDELRKRYREAERSQTFIDRCLTIADVCRDLEAANTTNDVDTYQEPGISYFYETEADYLSDSYYRFMSDNELIRPQLCFNKALHEGHEEPEVVESYLLEIFDATLPRYRLRNRLKMYVTYLDEETDIWDEFGDPHPTVLLVCANLTDLIYAKRRTRGLMAEIWERDDEDRARILFTTMQKLKQYGILTTTIWEKA